MGMKEDVDRANADAVDRMMEAEPALVDVQPAYKAIPVLSKGRTLTHAGPPISWERMSGPLKGAVIGAAVFEGWADTPEKAERLASSGELRFEPNHHHGAVGPMAGVISPNMPVFVVKNTKHGNVANTNMNEGLGAVLRMGAYSQEVLKRLIWIRDKLGPSLKTAIQSAIKKKNGIDLKSIISQALQMGDECHNRNTASTLLFLREISPFIIEGSEPGNAAEVVRFIDGNNHFFVNLAMAASKAMADAAHGVRYSTVLSAIARNGTDIGIRVSGIGDEWFTAPAMIPKGLYFPGFKAEDANPDIGDSTITETVGLGGAAMAASPAIVRFVGGTVQDALEMTRQMGQITVAKHRYFTIPYLEFEGTPTGIDIRKVLRTGITPRANTGIAHKKSGVGQIGAGVVDVPIEPFKAALAGFADKYNL